MLLFAVLLVMAACGYNRKEGQADTIHQNEPSEEHTNASGAHLSDGETAKPLAGEAAGDGQVFPKHKPYGKGIGAKPGRVVWSYNPKSVDWNGKGYWWKTMRLTIRPAKSTAAIWGKKKA